MSLDVVRLILILSHYTVAEPVQRRICYDITVNKCSKFFNGGNGLAPWPTLSPNTRNLDLTDSLTEFKDYNSLLVSKPGGYCTYMLYSFLCLHYFPICDPTRSQSKPHPLVIPCRRLCKAAVEECLSQITPTPIPEHLNCENFPEENRYMNRTATVVVACPPPAVHLEFFLNFGEEKLNAYEENCTIDICIKLSSTGTHDSLHSDTTVHLTAQDISAIGGGVDYDFSSCTELVFTEGMVKGDTLCCSVKIIDDGFIEEKEEFSVRASVSFTSKCLHGNSSTNEMALDFPEKARESSVRVCFNDNDAVHLEFCVEFGEEKLKFCLNFGDKNLNACEGSGSTIDICVKLSSTGTHDTLHSNATVRLTAQDNICAKGGGVDYDFSNCTKLVFTEGMVKGDTLCCSVEIIDDGLIEEKEEFSVCANVSFTSEVIRGNSSTNASGSGLPEPDLRFGGMFNSTSGSVEVCIIDNDVCSIHDRHCPVDVCNQRKSANKNTFKSNSNNTYTWAAHVELLQVTNSSTCTGLSVRMIKCCNLRRNEHCPENVEQLLISTCPGCPKSVVVNTQYLIAGNVDNHLIIPNTKKTGIFAIWEPKYETGIIDWNNC